ncbi:beta-ketoacyl-ACP synthase III [Streptomyces sp. NPDC007205]|uniref:beta-ketoacyl-ACP synthase III n=1 Tax=Streptomyces sp. NPDC007205 TaxID=3154316 RepID=UPI0033CBBC4F
MSPLHPNIGEKVSPQRGERARSAVIAGIGTCLPSRVVRNDELSLTLDTSDEWIRSRTGIRQRRWVEAGTATSDLAVWAGIGALRSAAGTALPEAVILATTTPDRRCPATAPEVAWRMGLGHVVAFDVGAMCSGFLYALSIAASMITAGNVRSAVVIGADTYSTIVDPKDRNTAVIFGDGAGAVYLRAGDPDEPGALFATHLASDGSHHQLISIAVGGSRQPEVVASDQRLRYLHMDGRRVFRYAVQRMTEAVTTVAAESGWKITELEALVAHQANQRILDAVGEELGLAPGKLVSNIGSLGNTAAASIPLAIADAALGKRVPRDAPTVLTAFGGGLTWGAAALTWPQALPVATIFPSPSTSPGDPDA